jgi:hypothetical protein
MRRNLIFVLFSLQVFTPRLIETVVPLVVKEVMSQLEHMPGFSRGDAIVSGSDSAKPSASANVFQPPSAAVVKSPIPDPIEVDPLSTASLPLIVDSNASSENILETNASSKTISDKVEQVPTLLQPIIDSKSSSEKNMDVDDEELLSPPIVDGEQSVEENKKKAAGGANNNTATEDSKMGVDETKDDEDSEFKGEEKDSEVDSVDSEFPPPADVEEEDDDEKSTDSDRRPPKKKSKANHHVIAVADSSDEEEFEIFNQK